MKDKTFLPNDVARCRGIGSDKDGWREGCENCARRLAINTNTNVYYIEPPLIIAFWCEFHIAV